MNNKSIKFNIELTSDNLSGDDMARIYEQITHFLDSVSDLVEVSDVNTKIIKEEIFPKYTGKYEGEDERRKQEITQSIKSFKDKFYDEDSFKKHISTLPIYKDPRPVKSLEYIKDYLMKNGHAKRKDIIKGCKEQGLQSKATNPVNEGIIFHSRVKKLMKRGLVSKQGRVYSWNYKED